MVHQGSPFHPCPHQSLRAMRSDPVSQPKDFNSRVWQLKWVSLLQDTKLPSSAFARVKSSISMASTWRRAEERVTGWTFPLIPHKSSLCLPGAGGQRRLQRSAPTHPGQPGSRRPGWNRKRRREKESEESKTTHSPLL